MSVIELTVEELRNFAAALVPGPGAAKVLVGCPLAAALERLGPYEEPAALRGVVAQPPILGVPFETDIRVSDWVAIVIDGHGRPRSGLAIKPE